MRDTNIGKEGKYKTTKITAMARRSPRTFAGYVITSQRPRSQLNGNRIAALITVAARMPFDTCQEPQTIRLARCLDQPLITHGSLPLSVRLGVNVERDALLVCNKLPKSVLFCAKFIDKHFSAVSVLEDEIMVQNKSASESAATRIHPHKFQRCLFRPFPGNLEPRRDAYNF